MLRGWWLLVLVVVACGGEPGLPIATWRVVAGPGAGQTRTVPISLADLDAPARFTYAARVELPEDLRGQPLSLAIAALRGRASLHVGGDEMPSNQPTDDWLQRMGPKLWHLPPAYTGGPELELQLTIDAESRQAGRLVTVPRLSADPAGDRSYRAVRAYSALVLPLTPTLLLILALVHTLLWWLDRRQSAYGWFSLQGMAAAVYAALAAGMFVDLLGQAAPAAAGVALCSSGTGAVFFTHRQFELGRVPRWIVVSYLGVVLAGLICATDAFLAERWFIPVYVAQGLLCVSHALVVHGGRVLTSRRGHRDPAAVLILIAWLTIALASVPEAALLLGGREILGGFRVFPLSTALFAALQTVALSLAHARSLRDAHRLNEELRRQIQERSRAIQQSLASRSGEDTLHHEEPDPLEQSYRVVRPLGSGGMGLVSEVERRSDGRRLALKRLTGKKPPDAVARFAREAEIAATVHHPNLVAITDVNLSLDGGMFLVMELVEGGSLRDARRHFGNRRWALRILAQMARGLAALHDKGIVHRDLKPGNVLLEEPDSTGHVVAKIADFGISMLLPPMGEQTLTAAAEATRSGDAEGEPVELDAEDPQLTRTGAFLGTPLYISPEQARDPRAATPASDVYSFGKIAFELLTGRREIIRRTRFDALQPPLPAPLAALLEACLEPGELRRPRATELAAALDEFA